MRPVALILFCALLTAVHIVSLGKATEEAKKLSQGEESPYVIPGPVQRITALDYDGIASDLLFLKTLVFLGSTEERREEPKVKISEWKWIYHALDAAASLDPYFLDPYYVGNANLTWSGGLINEANMLLEKGSQYRSWDALLPFFLGFNYFYFLEDDQKASEWLMEASRRPGASPVYASLAVKLSYKERRLENAIAFQEYIVEHTEDAGFRQEHQTRLNALRALFFLEKSAAEYKRRYGRYPKNVSDLLARHIIKEVPSDPYGGSYYIAASGRVKTSSEQRLTPYRHLNLFPSQPSLIPPGNFLN